MPERNYRKVLPNKVIRKLARKGGAKHLSGLCYDETRDVLKEYLEEMILIIEKRVKDDVKRLDQGAVTTKDVFHAELNYMISCIKRREAVAKERSEAKSRLRLGWYGAKFT